MHEVLVVLRTVNVALLGTCMVGFSVRIAETWPRLTVGRRLLMVGFDLLLVAGVAGSAIKYLTRAPVDLSIVIVSVAALTILAGLWISRHDGHLFASA